jgi:hypothetical protein
MQQRKYNVFGFMTLYYGKEYLRESLMSIVNHVDTMVIAYTSTPSHGYGSRKSCPDNEEELHKIALEVFGGRLIWDNLGQYNNESQHRNVKYKYSEGYSLCLTIDADEVFKEDEIETALNYAFNNSARYYGIDGYKNFWRSFDWVCLDGFRPIRIENLLVDNNIQDINCPLTIYHFSTAQSEEIMRFKYKVFGHASEIKPNYLDGIFYAWTPENNFGDLHPVSIGLWNAIPFDKNTLPTYLKEHINFNKKLI